MSISDSDNEEADRFQLKVDIEVQGVSKVVETNITPCTLRSYLVASTLYRSADLKQRLLK